MTAPDRIGYRFSLVNGTLPANLVLRTTAIEPVAGVLRLFFPDDTGSFDFTLQVVAVDLAGNESAPQNVHVVNAEPSDCSIGHTPDRQRGLVFVTLALLLLAGRRRRRCN
jgi:MYXO-CTERM domain-containing protein